MSDHWRVIPEGRVWPPRDADDWWDGYRRLLRPMQEWLDDMEVDEIVQRLESGVGRVFGRASLIEFWKRYSGSSTWDVLRKVYEDRAHEDAVRLVNTIWADLPDRADTRELPGFFVLCDLCSEAWVFQVPDEEIEPEED